MNRVYVLQIEMLNMAHEAVKVVGGHIYLPYTCCSIKTQKGIVSLSPCPIVRIPILIEPGRCKTFAETNS